MESPEDRIVMVLLMLLFPPFAVWYKEKSCVSSVAVNVLLYFLFVLPSYIHAIYVCFMRDRR